MRPFKYEQQDLNEKNIPFYTRIGLLSVRFSEVESVITHIIEKLINSDNERIGYLLIEQNVLDRNLKVLEQINRWRAHEEEKIKKIISEIRLLKDTRNFFIHGVWSDVQSNDNGETYIHCANHKWVTEKDTSHMEGFKGTLSVRYKHTKFTLQELDLTIKKSNEILFELKQIWENLQEVDYFE